jgi:hypothetical protein
MKSLTDQEIQELLEKGMNSNAAEEGFKTYELLFKELKKEPDTGLPYDFSAKVTAQLRLQQDLKPGFKYYLLALIIACVVISGVWMALITLRHTYADEISGMLIKYKWAMIFSLLCFLVIKYFDHQLQYALLSGRKNAKQRL